MYTDLIIGLDGSPSGRDVLALGRWRSAQRTAAVSAACRRARQTKYSTAPVRGRRRWPSRAKR